jgi:hypothetical protein
MTIALMERGRPLPRMNGPHTATEQATAECRACLGRDVATVLRTYDNFEPIGPVCLFCVGAVTDYRRPVTERQCDGCGDGARVRVVGRAGYCSFCVVVLADLVVAG